MKKPEFGRFSTEKEREDKKPKQLGFDLSISKKVGKVDLTSHGIESWRNKRGLPKPGAKPVKKPVQTGIKFPEVPGKKEEK